MKFPREKIAAALGIAKVIIAGCGVFASVRNLVDSVREVKSGRSRKVLYVDAGDIPADKMEDYMAEADRYLRASRGSQDSDEPVEEDSDGTGGYSTRRRRRKTRTASGYASRTRVRKY